MKVFITLNRSLQTRATSFAIWSAWLLPINKRDPEGAEPLNDTLKGVPLLLIILLRSFPPVDRVVESNRAVVLIIFNACIEHGLVNGYLL